MKHTVFCIHTRVGVSFVMHILSVNFLLIFFCLIAAYVSNCYQVYIKDIKSIFSLPYVCYNIDRWYPL